MINLHHGPFSMFGSHLAFNYLPAHWNLPGLVMRSMRGTGGVREAFFVRLCRQGRELPAEATATPVELILRAEDGTASARFTFASPNRIQFTVEGADLVFASIEGQKQHGFPLANGAYLVNAPEIGAHFQFAALSGDLQGDTYTRMRTQEAGKPVEFPDGSWTTLTFADGSAGLVDDYECAAPAPVAGPYGEALAFCEGKWAEWLEAMPSVPSAYREAAETAMYVNYAAGLTPSSRSPLRRPTILMSKNWMVNCWSWDHCFNAVAHAPADADLAWDQWMTLFDHQSPEGMLPDFVGPVMVNYNFCKPPIHGWALRVMMRNPLLLTPERTRLAYEKLLAWTRWWMETRDTDGDGIPEYQHGNDSGWDNGTCFDRGFPVTTPDLPAHLAVQFETLALLAGRLGRSAEEAAHRESAHKLAAALVERLWDGERPFARKADGTRVDTGDSLLPYTALIAGELLPADVREKLVAGVERFVTPSGVATECPESPLYVPDGYWRGPVWGSSTTLLVEGLARCGAKELARRVAKAYCDNAVRTGCLAENYNALTGEPLRDRAYTWGSSAFLHLAHAYLGKEDVPVMEIPSEEPHPSRAP